MKFDFLAITLEKKNIENLEIKKEEEWIFETKNTKKQGQSYYQVSHTKNKFWPTNFIDEDDTRLNFQRLMIRNRFNYHNFGNTYTTEIWRNYT